MVLNEDKYKFYYCVNCQEVGSIKPKTNGVPGMVYIERIDRVFTGERWGDTSRKAAGDRVQAGKSHALDRHYYSANIDSAFLVCTIAIISVEFVRVCRTVARWQR